MNDALHHPANDAPAGAAKRMDEEDRAPMGMTVRVVIYLVAVHFFAAFLFLLFFLAGG
ncbi:hypothetical protein IPZ58_12970 [Streptomyces roseoverticillatus]|uniref:DUF6126 family protein n=1 Tax=Streptomyces roseoverticillatus TaxID=66429 RepID=UPI0035AB784A|nr:hypothetical protein [Streptomyces roseoverticillatus]